jgi:hypothetical protein
MVIARVTKVIYGPFLLDGTTPDPDYTDISSIGCIRYIIYNSRQFFEAQGAANKIARPAFSFIHQYPAENEYVYIIPGPSVEQNETAGGPVDYFYLPPFNLWRAPQHNAFPNLVELTIPYNFQNTDYLDATDGVARGPEVPPPTTPLGEGFPELPDIKSIKPFPGDVMFEGRWGQSIRFGSSNTINVGSNPWANSNNDGDPIMIIRNGQGNQVNKDGYELTVENINVDNSSIYLTAGQSITITDLASFPLTSWNVSAATTENAVTIVETTIPPLANTTLSAQQQDESTVPIIVGAGIGVGTAIPTANTGSDSKDPRSGAHLGLSEEQLLLYDQEYVNFYNDLYARTGKFDDGFDGYYHYKSDNLIKTVQINVWVVSNPGEEASGVRYTKADFPTKESLIQRLTNQNPRFPEKLADGRKVITSFQGNETVSDDDAKAKVQPLIFLMQRRNGDKIKTTRNTPGN